MVNEKTYLYYVLLAIQSCIEGKIIAGFRLTLKKLAKKYGVDIRGLTYTQLIHEIINDNAQRASKKMGDISNRRMKKAFEESIQDGIIEVPDYAVPNVTLRKSADDGKIITDTLRDNLTRGLRQAIIEHPNDVEGAIAQMQQSVKDVFTTYTTSHAKMIAVTEVRSSVDLSKAEYVKEMLARNPNKLIVTKRWVHHDHLVKIPRPSHKAIDGERVLFSQPFSIGLMYPHDPNAPASEVINCQCGYVIEVEEKATDEIYKALKSNINAWVFKAKAGINPATGKPWQIGDTKTRPDGTKWVKTGTFSWAKAGTKDAEEAKKRDKDNDGKVEPKEKPDWVDQDMQNRAIDKLKAYGEKGIYTMTKGELLNLLYSNGVDNPKALSWQEKMSKYKELVEQGVDAKAEIKTQGKEEFTEEDFHILHNTSLYGDTSSLENTVMHTRNGDVTLKYTADGKLTDQCYDELKTKIEPIQGGHWGSASTHNDVALAVALVNAPEWKPIDEMQNGNLAVYNQKLSNGEYMRALTKGIGLRKYAQEKLKHPDMSREKIPNFYRGMTVSADQYEQILAGEADTIELTGCTAVTSFEEVADQYASSQWTKGFGADRRSIKLVIERDDYMDNSIGMFHHNTKGYAHGNHNIGFELLTGSPSFYVKSVEQSDGWNVDKSTEKFREGLGKFDGQAQSDYDKVKDIDLTKIYKPDDFYKYEIKDSNGDTILKSDYYNSVVEKMSDMRANAEVEDLNRKIAEWATKYYKDNVKDFFSRVKNKSLRHSNNQKLLDEWTDKLTDEWRKTPMYKQVQDIGSHAKYLRIPDNIDQNSYLPDEASRKAIDAFYNSPEWMNWRKSNALQNPMVMLDRYTLNGLYNDYLQNQPIKRSGLTFSLFLDKRRPLEKSYKTQVDKTAQEYKEFEDYYKWQNAELLNADRMQDTEDKWIRDLLKKYNLQETDLGNAIRTRENGKKVIYPYRIPHGEPTGISPDDWGKIRDEFYNVNRARPVPTQDGINIFAYNIKDEDNPYLTPEIIKNPMWQKAKNKEYAYRRYSQLQNMRTNYENAKRDNELMKKYDVEHTSRDTMEKRYREAIQKRDDTLTKELVDVMKLYNDYNNKIAEEHKNLKPLVVHVVCGRGKKTITGGDDTLEGEDND